MEDRKRTETPAKTTMAAICCFRVVLARTFSNHDFSSLRCDDSSGRASIAAAGGCSREDSRMTLIGARTPSSHKVYLAAYIPEPMSR